MHVDIILSILYTVFNYRRMFDFVCLLLLYRTIKEESYEANTKAISPVRKSGFQAEG